jgi:hypothetical protein
VSRDYTIPKDSSAAEAMVQFARERTHHPTVFGISSIGLDGSDAGPESGTDLPRLLSLQYPPSATSAHRVTGLVAGHFLNKIEVIPAG